MIFTYSHFFSLSTNGALCLHIALPLLGQRINISFVCKYSLATTPVKTITVVICGAKELSKRPTLATSTPTMEQMPGPNREIKPLNMMPERKMWLCFFFCKRCLIPGFFFFWLRTWYTVDMISHKHSSIFSKVATSLLKKRNHTGGYSGGSRISG